MKKYEKIFVQIFSLSLLIQSINNSGGNDNNNKDKSEEIILSTIPTTILTNIPTTIPTNIPKTLPTTIPTDIPITIEDTKISYETDRLKEEFSIDYNETDRLKEEFSIDYNETDRCWQTEPTKDIIEDCTMGSKLEIETCCYMTVKYKYNSMYGCIPIMKDEKIIKERIKLLKKIYIGNKSIQIDCFAYFVKSSLLSLLLFFI